MEHYFNDGTEPTILRQPRIPLGCDQQGRHPQAAEASTEIGLEEPEHDMFKVVLVDVLIAVAAMAVLAVTVLLLAGRL
jgi:hypothetical protein